MKVPSNSFKYRKIAISTEGKKSSCNSRHSIRKRYHGCRDKSEEGSRDSANNLRDQNPLTHEIREQVRDEQHKIWEDTDDFMTKCHEERPNLTKKKREHGRLEANYHESTHALREGIRKCRRSTPCYRDRSRSSSESTSTTATDHDHLAKASPAAVIGLGYLVIVPLLSRILPNTRKLHHPPRDLAMMSQKIAYIQRRSQKWSFLVQIQLKGDSGFPKQDQMVQEHSLSPKTTPKTKKSRH